MPRDSGPDPTGAGPTGAGPTGAGATGAGATGAGATGAGATGAGPAGADPAAADPTGLDLARAAADRVAARPGARRRRPGPRTGTGTGAGVPPAGPRRATPTGRVGGLASDEPFTGPRPERGDPARVGGALRELVAARGWGPRTDAAAVLARWPELVGGQTAEHCRPVGLEDGRLRVAADSSVWATQLRLLAPRLVAAVNDRVGTEVVTELVVEGPTAPSWRHGRLGVAGGRGPRDTYG